MRIGGGRDDGTGGKKKKTTKNKKAYFLQLYLDSAQNSPSLPFTLDTFSPWSQFLLLLFFKQLADSRLCISIASLGFQDSESCDSIFMAILNRHGI